MHGSLFIYSTMLFAIMDYQFSLKPGLLVFWFFFFFWLVFCSLQPISQSWNASTIPGNTGI